MNVVRFRVGWAGGDLLEFRDYTKIRMELSLTEYNPRPRLRLFSKFFAESWDESGRISSQ